MNEDVRKFTEIVKKVDFLNKLVGDFAETLENYYDFDTNTLISVNNKNSVTNFKVIQNTTDDIMKMMDNLKYKK